MSRGRGVETVIAQRGELVVEQDRRRASGRLLRHADMDSSYIDLADPRHLEFDYLRWMRVVLRVAHARRVLHVGGGACALARALAADDPDGRQQVCEIDADVLDLAREHLGLRRMPGLRVRRAEGRRFVARQDTASWDAIVIDAFLGARVPRRLITVQAMADVARVAPLVLVNVVDDRAAREVRAVAAAIIPAYPFAWTIGGRVGNIVVAGSQARLDLSRIAARVAADPSPGRITVPDDLARQTAGTPGIRDDEI